MTPLPLVILNLEGLERKGKHYKNLDISRTKRAFWMKQKTFSVFERLLFSAKIKIGQKIADTSFKNRL